MDDNLPREEQALLDWLRLLDPNHRLALVTVAAFLFADQQER